MNERIANGRASRIEHQLQNRLDHLLIMQPEVLLADDLRAGHLVQILPDYAPASRPMHVLFAADRRPPAKIRTFVDFLVERFGEM